MTPPNTQYANKTAVPIYDAPTVKHAARGQWSKIIPQVAMCVSADVLDGQHHPCPRCGGNDRFRFTDQGGDGSAICNSCFHDDNGDGFNTVMHFAGLSFADALRAVADVCRVEPKNKRQELLTRGKDSVSHPGQSSSVSALLKVAPSSTDAAEDSAVKTEKIDPAKDLAFGGWSLISSRPWERRKVGCTVAAVKLAGGRYADYSVAEVPVIAFPVRGPELMKGDPVGYVLWSIDPNRPMKNFDATGKPTDDVKVKCSKGTDHGIVNDHAVSVLADPIKRAAVTHVYKTEGLSDLNALLSIIPAELRDTHIAFSNPFGAGETPKTWIIDLILTCPALQSIAVIHDADVAGREGSIGRPKLTADKKPTGEWAPGWCDHFAVAVESAGRSASITVRNVVLPYAEAESHGKDLRDWITEPPAVPFDDPRGFTDFLSLVSNSPVHAPNEAAVRAVNKVRGQADAIKHPAPGEPGDPPAGRRDEWADGIPDAAVVNGIPGIGTDKKGKEIEVINRIDMAAIIARIHRAANGWPCRVQGRLFTHKAGTSDPVHYLEKPDNLFGYLGSVGPCGPPTFYNKPGFHTMGQTFAELCRTAKAFRAIETVPHEPPLAEHYYACETVRPGDVSTLDALLNRFSPETNTDYDLIKAMFATAVWGGPGGSRPMFVITSLSGRGAGKSTLAEMVGLLVGGIMSFSAGEDIEEMMKRLLSPAGLCKRVALIDNLKTHRFSWAELESMVTASELSGRQLYVGEASRPNTLTWIVTLNGVSLSTDIAQRSVVIRIRRPVHSGDWAEGTRHFILKNRMAIIADLVAFLRSPRSDINKSTRWGEWEREIISRLPEPTDAQYVIRDRAKAADAEDEEGDIVLDYIRKKVEKYYPTETNDDGLTFYSEHKVFISSSLLHKWYKEATGDNRVTVTTTSRIFKQRIESGSIHSMTVDKNHRNGRGFIWWPWKIRFDATGNPKKNLNVVDEDGEYLPAIVSMPVEYELEKRIEESEDARYGR